MRLREHAGRAHHRVLQANYAIHEAFITLADNRWLAQVIGDLRKILRLARHQTLRVPGRLQQSLAEHLQVFAALKSGDAGAAEQAMRQHLLAQREALRCELARNPLPHSTMNNATSAWISRNVERLRPARGKAVAAKDKPGTARASPSPGAVRTSAWRPRCAVAARPCRRARCVSCWPSCRMCWRRA